MLKKPLSCLSVFSLSLSLSVSLSLCLSVSLSLSLSVSVSLSLSLSLSLYLLSIYQSLSICILFHFLSSPSVTLPLKDWISGTADSCFHPLCESCQRSCTLVMQVYAPLADCSDERTLYIFVCARNECPSAGIWCVGTLDAVCPIMLSNTSSIQLLALPSNHCDSLIGKLESSSCPGTWRFRNFQFTVPGAYSNSQHCHSPRRYVVLWRR